MEGSHGNSELQILASLLTFASAAVIDAASNHTSLRDSETASKAETSTIFVVQLKETEEILPSLISKDATCGEGN